MHTESRSPILRYTLDAVPQVLRETTGGQSTRNLYGLDLFAQQQGGTTAYLGYDALSVRLHLVDGAVAAQYRYGPFGEVVGEGPEGYGYTGEQWDHYTELSYLRARYYSPALGRFLSRDQFVGYVEIPQTQNRYSYTANRPTMFVDPMGLNWQHPNKAEGILIHNMIEENYVLWARAKGEVARGEAPIPLASKQGHLFACFTAAVITILTLNDPELNRPGVADIVNYTTREIYEIKHIPSWTHAQNEATWYVTVLNALPQDVRDDYGYGLPNWHEGVSIPPGDYPMGWWPGDPTAEVWAKPYGPGAIAYWGKKVDLARIREVQVHPYIPFMPPVPRQGQYGSLPGQLVPVPVEEPILWPFSLPDLRPLLPALYGIGTGLLLGFAMRRNRPEDMWNCYR